MKYKALLTDIDGTLIPNKKEGLVSEKVTKAIRAAAKKIHIGVVTSRDPEHVTHLATHLSLSGPSVVLGGALLVDFPSFKTVWKKEIERDAFDEIYALATKGDFQLFIGDESKLYDMSHTDKQVLKNPLEIWGHGLTHIQLEEFHKSISHIPSVSFHRVPSWKEGKIDFAITHTLATKQHAVFELMKLLDIKPEEIIAVGDGANDIPLLLSAGLKVAVGNAVPELKEIADYIAPSVEEDGLADVIEKFVLS